MTKKRYLVMGMILLAGIIVSGIFAGFPFEHSVSNLYIIPAGHLTSPELTHPDSMDLYSAPLGAFRNSWAVLTPNTTYETDYVFYSNAWGPGEVNYTLSGPVISDPGYKNWNVSISPSTFVAEPGNQYISRVSVKTDSPSFGDYGLFLNINVTLSDNSTHFGNDSIILFPGMPPGLYSVGQDFLWVTTPVSMKKGETRNYSIFYERRRWAGFGDIVYSVSQSPLNPIITLSTIHVKQGIRSPSVISLTAPSSIPSGNYTFNISVKGASPWLTVRDETGQSYYAPLDQPQKIIPIDVSVG